MEAITPSSTCHLSTGELVNDYLPIFTDYVSLIFVEERVGFKS